MYNLHLSTEQLEIRDTVRDFVAREIKPVVLKADRLDACDRSLPMELLDKASQMGLRTLALSEDWGGAGADHLTRCIVTEELAAGDADIAAALAETSRLGHLLFDDAMTGAQRDRFLPKFLADDRYHLAFADRETATDTRLGVNYHRAVATESTVTTVAAKASSGEWIVNGVKDCVPNAPIAALFAVLVTIPGRQGASILLVPADAPGLTVRAHEKAWRHGPCGDVTFKDCRVPASYLLGEEAATLLSGADRPGRGVPLFQALNLGVGRAAYEAALDYAHLRMQGGRPIIEHQAIGTKLAGIAINLEVARAIIWQAAWASDHPAAYADRSLSDLPLQAVAQVITSEMMLKAAKDAAEIFGAMGVMRDVPMQKYVHDARVCLHSGDGNSDAKLRIAEVLAGYQRAANSAMAIAGE
jgi:alkylation response protein AidB-like acyl-CoA dehydrogenase